MRKAAIALVALALGACGGGVGQTAMPTPAMSDAEIQQLGDEAAAFADQSITAWPDVDRRHRRILASVGRNEQLHDQCDRHVPVGGWRRV